MTEIGVNVFNDINFNRTDSPYPKISSIEYLYCLTQCVAAVAGTLKNDIIFEIKPVYFYGCVI